MPRIRYLKPEFFLDEHIAELKYEHRLAYQGLWVHADREGRIEGTARLLKVMVFPFDDVDMEAALTALEKKPFIIRYSVGEKQYIQIINWHKHQRPHITEKESKLPSPQGAGQANDERGSESVIPSIDDVINFMKDIVEANKFFNHYSSNGWKIGGKTPMKDWKAKARNWMIERGESDGKKKEMKVTGV